MDILKRISFEKEYFQIYESDFIDFEMLLIGKNQYGEYLIQSYLKEDIENDELVYLHVFAANQVFLDFLEGKISYLNVLQQAKQIYKVRKEYNYEIIDYELINFEDLTSKQKPLKSSFFPTDLPLLKEELKNITISIPTP
jgi:hypothetical protein